MSTNGLIQTKLSNRLLLAFQQVLIIPSNAKTDEDVYVFGNNLNGRLENSESLRSSEKLVVYDPNYVFFRRKLNKKATSVELKAKD